MYSGSRKLIELIRIIIVFLVALIIIYFIIRGLVSKKFLEYSATDSARRKVLIYSAVLTLLSSLLIIYSLIGIKHRSYAPEIRETTATILAGEVMLMLPYPRSGVFVENALLNRKSIREWSNKPISVEDLSLILWASYGVVEEIDSWFRRTSPSAGATYPMEIYVVIGERSVATRDGFLEAGVYKYDPLRHSLKIVKRGDYRRDLYRAALEQEWVLKAPVSIVICAVYKRTTRIYGERGYRYVYMEAGHIGQNIYLMATAMGLGTVAVGAFYDDVVSRVISSLPEEEPVYIFPVGVPAEPFINDFKRLERFYEKMRSKA